MQVALGGLEHDKALKDLDVVAFSKAPREAMARTLDYIECVARLLFELLLTCSLLLPPVAWLHP